MFIFVSTILLLEVEKDDLECAKHIPKNEIVWHLFLDPKKGSRIKFLYLLGVVRHSGKSCGTP